MYSLCVPLQVPCLPFCTLLCTREAGFGGWSQPGSFALWIPVRFSHWGSCRRHQHPIMGITTSGLSGGSALHWKPQLLSQSPLLRDKRGKLHEQITICQDVGISTVGQVPQSSCKFPSLATDSSFPSSTWSFRLGQNWWEMEVGRREF